MAENKPVVKKKTKATKTKPTAKKSIEEKKEIVFTKQQLAKSKKYAAHRDVLNAILDDGKKYTFKQVDEALETFLKGKVKK